MGLFVAIGGQLVFTVGNKLDRRAARDKLEVGIDALLCNLYPVTPLDRAVRVYDQARPLSSYAARLKKSPNRDLDLLEREWRLRHYDRFAYYLHPERVERSLSVSRYSLWDGPVHGPHDNPPPPPRFVLPPRTIKDERAKISLYQYGSRADRGAFAPARLGESFELLPLQPDTHLVLLTDRDGTGRIDLVRARARIRRGSRAATGPIDSFDPFTVYVGCAVSARRGGSVVDSGNRFEGPVLYRPCPLRMDLTSQGADNAVKTGDFTRGGKLMKRDVVAAVEDGLAAVARLAGFYAGANEKSENENVVCDAWCQELMRVRCSECYVQDPRVDAGQGRPPLRVVVELARPGVPFAAASIFEVTQEATDDTDDALGRHTRRAHSDDRNTTHCLLRRRFFAPLAGIDMAHPVNEATLARAGQMLWSFVMTLRATLTLPSPM